jgi:hypothetical protein
VGERVTKVHMQAFRGVSGNLTVEFPRGVSAVLYGANATGKSTIADALEWYFRGSVDFLRAEGRGAALRHVGAPATVATTVTVETTDVLGGTRTLGQETESHVLGTERETFLLRGRTLTEFIESTKGEKWKILAEILGLAEVDALRLDLQTAKNELRKLSDAAAAAHRDACAALQPTVGHVDEEGILAAITDRCRDAQIAAPESLSAALDTQWSDQIGSTTPKDSRAARLSALTAEVSAWSPDNVDLGALEAWNQIVSTAAPDQARIRLYRAAEPALTGTSSGTCPLCGQQVDIPTLRTQVRHVLNELQATASAWDQAAEAVHRVAAQLEGIADRATGLYQRARSAGADPSTPPTLVAANLRTALEQRTPIDPAPYKTGIREVMRWKQTLLDALRTAMPPVATAKEQALVQIGGLLDQARRWRSTAAAAQRTKLAAEQADAVFHAYQQQQHAYIKDVLDQVSRRAAEIYAKLHPGEQLTDLAVEPWGEKGAELALSFHGVRQKPPHGVLSESHLNSLAVALFLAMTEAFNERLGFLVLDDVVNSFDMEHRGQLAWLLANEFEDRQIIVLTHDQLFFDRICKLAPHWTQIEFTSWTFSDGPRMTGYRADERLEEARALLESGDREGAAMKGRKALEELLQEAAEAFQAPLPFRRGRKNDYREVGEVMNGLRSFLKRSFKHDYDQLRGLLDSLEADVAAALNPAVHASQSVPAVAEVRAALDRIAQLKDAWTCPDLECGTRIWHRGSPAAFRCKCGKTTLPSARHAVPQAY